MCNIKQKNLHFIHYAIKKISNLKEVKGHILLWSYLYILKQNLTIKLLIEKKLSKQH